MIPTPIIENYEKLAPVIERLYRHTDDIAHMAILPLFLLSVLMAYSQDLGLQGAVVSRLRRLIVTMLLLVAFPSLTGFIKNLGQEIALSIDNLQGIDEFLRAASEKASSYGTNVSSLLDFGNDLVISLLVSVSFVILYVARYILIAFYHFYWMILLVTGPFLILGNLFDSTSHITKNLMKNLVLVACWPIVWSILSSFLKALPFQDAYAIEGGYTAVVIMNLILAFALLFSPFMLSQFCEGSLAGMGSGLVSTGVRTASTVVGAKTVLVASRLGEKAAPFIHSRSRLLTALGKGAAKGGKMVLAVLMLPALANADAKTINVRPGLSSVLCFKRVPDSVALGDGRYFQAQKVGKNLLLRAAAEDKETNLLVFAGGGLAGAYVIQSNVVLPHTVSTGCEEVKNVAASAKPNLGRVRVFSSAEKNGVRAELLRKAWTSPRRDYFNLKVRLHNQGTKTLSPDWSKIVLRQEKKVFQHSGISAERRELPPGSEVIFDIQFTRPEISKNRGFLVIPTKGHLVELLVEKGAAN